MSELDLDGLVSAVHIESVRHDELRGQRIPAGDGQPSNSLTVNATRHPDRIEVVCGVEHTTADARYRVVTRATFRAAEVFEVADATMTAFVEQVGVMVTYPFLREAVRDLSVKIGAEPVLLELIRPGQIRLGLQGKAGSN